MKCPNCGERLKVVHTYAAGDDCRTQRLVCLSCETVVTAAIVILNENPTRFRGAVALARKIASGEIEVGVEIRAQPARPE